MPTPLSPHEQSSTEMTLYCHQRQQHPPPENPELFTQQNLISRAKKMTWWVNVIVMQAGQPELEPRVTQWEGTMES